MPAKWLGFLLARRYAINSMGDPVPSAFPVTVSPASPHGTDGGTGSSTLSNATPADALVSTKSAAPALPPECPDSSASTVTPAAELPAAHQTDGPFLILPNHPALVDPLIVYAHFAALHPLLILERAQSQGLRLLRSGADICLLAPPPHADNAPPIPGATPVHTAPPTSATPALERAAEALAAGRSVILWPCTRLQSHGRECVQDDSLAFALLTLLQERRQQLPELFLVRTEGLWGSRFSCYHDATRPPAFFSTLCAQIPALLLGPLLKRRPVRIVTRRHKLQTKQTHQQSFKNILTTWFDAGSEEAVLVPRLAFCRVRRMPLEHTRVPAQEALSPERAPCSTAGEVPPCATVEPAATAASAPTAPLAADAQREATPVTVTLDGTGAHSSPATQPHAQQSSTAPDPQSKQNAEPTDLADTISAIKPATNAPLADIAPAVPRTPPFLPVQHALTRQGSVTDASYGHHFSRRTLLGLAKAIGTLLGPIPATRIGIALPCGVGAMAAYMGILDCTLEDSRIPVLLSPDMPGDQLAHCASATGITHVVTSHRLKGKGLPPGTVPIYLEEITAAQIMRGSALSFMGFAGPTEMDTPAAVFCPPTDGLPLCTGLSHQELMTSLHTLIENFAAPPLRILSLSILGCLPPYSPLGLLLNAILPLTCGVPIVTVGDTHDGALLARCAENYSANVFTGSPDSLRILLHHARSQLGFRYILLTQDTCSEELLNLVPKACPHAQLFTADMFGNVVLM